MSVLRLPAVVEVPGSLAPSEVSGLVTRVARLWHEHYRVVCRVSGPLGLGAVDGIAQLCLLSRRSGSWLRVHGTDEDGVLRLTGLATVVRLEVGGQAEAGEQPRVEEVVDVRDPAV